MPRRTQAEAQETRDHILQAGVALGTEFGFERLSLEQVAHAANVTRGAVYHHFDNKHGLFSAMVQHVLGRMGEAIERSAGVVDSDWEGLCAGCHAFLELSQAPAYQQIVLNDGPAVLGIEVWSRIDYKHTTARLEEAIRALTHSGVVTVPSIPAAAEALSGAMNQLSRWIQAGNPFESAVATLDPLLNSLRTGASTQGS